MKQLLCSLQWRLVAMTIAGSAIAQEEPNRVPVDINTFAQIAEHFQYDRSMPLKSQVIGFWPHRNPYTIEKVSFESIHGKRVPAYFACPKDTNGTQYPAVLLLHGRNEFWGKNEDWALEWMDILARSNRCVLVPDLPGFGERKQADEPYSSRVGPYTRRDMTIQSVTDQRRGLDYLFSRFEVDTTKVGLLGGSMGGYYGTLVAGLDKRLSAVVITVAGAWPSGVSTNDSFLQYRHTLNFAPRISAPVLMVNATGDGREGGEELFMAMPEPKKQIWYESSHYLPPREYNADIMAWLDLHLR